MPHKDYTFLVGAPGSKWSGVGQLLTDSFLYNRSDEQDWRVYRHGEFSGHRGSYFGPGMELGHNFHRLEHTYKDDVVSFIKDCNRAFDLVDIHHGTKMIKCNQFAYSLEWLMQVPNSNILLIKRESQKSFDWWKEAGGWNITYPIYDWYVDDHHMKHYIDAEIKLADNFIKQNNDKWSPFTKEWITQNFGEHDIDVTGKEDLEVCIIDTI